MNPHQPLLSPQLHARLLAAVVVLVVYGSLFPFHYESHQPEWADLLLLLQPGSEHHSKSDLIGNVLLFVPYGFLIGLQRIHRRTGLALLAGAALALLVQYLQYWFPDRDPSGLDAVLNGAGMLLGLALERLATPLLRGWMDSTLPRPHLVLMSSGLMLLWLLDRWFPLVPTLDVQNLKDDLKPLLDWSQIGAVDVLRHLAGWLVFLRLARYSLLQRLGWPALWMLCVMLVALEPLFQSNTIGPDNLVGVTLALVLAPLLSRGPVSLALIAVILALTIAASALMPFSFAWQGGFGWVPLASSLTGDPLTAIPPLIEKTYWYGSLVFMLRYLGVSHRRTCWMTGVMLLGLELMQQWTPGHTPEVTDPLLALAMAWLNKPFFEQTSQAGATHPGRQTPGP